MNAYDRRGRPEGLYIASLYGPGATTPLQPLHLYTTADGRAGGARSFPNEHGHPARPTPTVTARLVSASRLSPLPEGGASDHAADRPADTHLGPLSKTAFSAGIRRRGGPAGA